MTTVAENKVLHDSLAGITLGEPRPHGGLAVVPLLNFGATDPDWLTLDEAIGAGALTVTEVSEGGSVPTLRVTNGGERAVLLLDSEELVGAKQNRILNTSVLIGAGQTVDIPVSCVEQGRWAYRTRHFESASRSLYASVRRKKTARVHESLLAKAGHQADQGAIWSDLAARAAAFQVASPTGAMGDAFEVHSGRLEEFRGALAPVEGQVGAIVYGGGEWWGLELLPGPRLFGKAWARLLPGYAMDALLAPGGKKGGISAASRLEAVLRARVEVFTTVGLGEDFRFRGDGLVGAALVAEGRLAHLMAFPV